MAMVTTQAVSVTTWAEVWHDSFFLGIFCWEEDHQQKRRHVELGWLTAQPPGSGRWSLLPRPPATSEISVMKGSGENGVPPL